MAKLEIDYVVGKDDMRKILFGASDKQIKMIEATGLTWPVVYGWDKFCESFHNPVKVKKDVQR